jgi:membrane-bound lytic murein transglycosylase F
MKRYQIILITAAIFFTLGWITKSYIQSGSTFGGSPKHSLLQKIKDKKRLDVVILNSPTVYYIGPQGPLGFEYDLLKAYADYIGVELNLIVVHTVEQALAKSKEHVGDLTAAGLSITEQRKEQFMFGPQYYTVQEQLVCNRKMRNDGTFPKDIEDLVDLKIVVGEGTSYVQTLKDLQNEELKELKFETTDKYSTQQLLKMAWKREIDCSVADSNIFSINQRYYPELSRAMVLSDRKALAWILRPGDTSVKKSLYEWLNIYERSGKMAELRDRYYSFLNLFDYYDTKVFYKRLKKRLPKYIKYFKEAAKQEGIPWGLLAAQSYQESHWNPRAKSHTGVRGMMMLTLKTAKQMGVKNRMDAVQSIFGGAKYLASIEKRFPKEIKGANRWAFTLAAYNVGMGHIHDAQVLARKLNKNPYSWSDIKTVLPLLSQKRYYKHLKYGYARGSEPVKYVESILHYVDMINKKIK